MTPMKQGGGRLALVGLSVLWALTGQAAVDDDPKTIQAAQQSLEAETRPTAGLIVTALGDDNQIEVFQVGAQGDFWLSPAWPLKAQAMWGDFSQDRSDVSGSNDFERVALHLFLKEYRFRPELWVSGRLTGEFFEEDELVGGQAGVRWQQENRSLWSLDAASESFWTQHDVRDPRQYPRVNNLDLIEPDARINRVWGTVDLVPLPEQQLRLQAGVADYREDDNEQLFAYAHYQLPVLDSEAGQWTVLRPNVYFEHFEDSSPAYFSPDEFVALGLAGHTIRQDPVNRLEFEVNPVILFEDGDVSSDNDTVEYGIHAVLDYTRRLDRDWTVGAGGFFYAETTDYWLWRATAHLTYKF